jgi:DNA-binding LacI/PurR family transcriptional regulator
MQPAKRATLTDIAAEAGVSVMTASYTYSRPARVSAAARARVLAAADRLGYSGPDPRARSLRFGKTLTLGIVLGEHLGYAFEDPQAAAFLAGIAQVCTEHAYGLTILPTTGAEQDVERIQQAAVDGFVVWTTTDDDPVLAAVRRTGRPAVVHGGPAVDGLGFVGMDDSQAAEAVAGVAFDGATAPAVVSFPLDRRRQPAVTSGEALEPAAFPITRDRLAGFRRAAEHAGFDWGDVAVAVCSRNDRREAEQAARALLTGPRPPDAVAAMGDELAAGVVGAARSLGVAVPDDLVVTGWDDSPVAAQLGLSTIAQSLREQGALCARQVLAGEVATVSVPWRLVRRTGRR